MAEEKTTLSMPGNKPAPEMVLVKVLRGYWPVSRIEDHVLDPNKPKLTEGTLCKMTEDEAAPLEEAGVVKVMSGTAYNKAKAEAAELVANPPKPRLISIPRTR